MYWPIICLFSGANLGKINRFSVMFSLHAQLTRDSAPDARYKKLLLNSVLCWACALVACMLHCGPWLELLGSGQFNGVQWKWLQSFAVVSTATSHFWRAYLWPLCAFSVCQCFTGPPKGNFFVIARSASKALSEVGLCSCFIVGICINFFVSSCTHLSFACFLRLFTFCLVFIELVSS